MSDKLTLEDLRKKKRPNQQSITIAGDSEAADLLVKAQEELRRAEAVLRVFKSKQNNDKAIAEGEATVAAAQREVELMEEAVGDSVLQFVFRAIGRKAYEDLVTDHQMDAKRRAELLTRHQIKDDEYPTNWDPDTFPIALIAASMVSPVLDKDDIIEWLADDTWNDAEIAALFQAALEVNTTRKVVDLGKGSRGI